MGDKTKGSVEAWKRNVRALQAERDVRPGAKPEALRSMHWTAYKAVLADLEWAGALTREQVTERVNRIRQTAALAAFRRGGYLYVHISPRRE